jgi:hypothetical protein
MTQMAETQALMAEVKDDKLIALAFEVSTVGTFFRVNGKWATVPDVDDEDAYMVVIDPSRARELITKFDAKTPMSMVDVEQYEADQAFIDLIFPPAQTPSE